MKAFVSGQAGMAAVVDGDETTFVRLDPHGGTLAVDPRYACSALNDADDLVELPITFQTSVPDLLDLAWRNDRALQLFLIWIDGREGDETVELAAKAIEDLFRDKNVRDFVENRMYGSPLPPSVNIPRARAGADSKLLVAEVIATLDRAQSAVRRCRESWDNLDTEMFGGATSKALFRQAAIDSGIFRAFALAANDRSRLADVVDFCHDVPELKGYPQARKVLSRWAEAVLFSGGGFEGARQPRPAIKPVVVSAARVPAARVPAAYELPAPLIGWQINPEELFKACRDTTNAEAWGQFYRRYDGLIRTAVRRVLARAPGSGDILEDLVQETYLRLTRKDCRALADFRMQGPNTDLGFVKSMAVSTVLDHFKCNSISTISFEEIQKSTTQEPDIDRALLVGQCLDAATEDGPNCERDRGIFLLYFRLGLKAREIAALRNIGLDTKGVESVIHKTVGAIKKRLQLRPPRLKLKKGKSEPEDLATE